VGPQQLQPKRLAISQPITSGSSGYGSAKQVNGRLYIFKPHISKLEKTHSPLLALPKNI
jgi:hypothetical protein